MGSLPIRGSVLAAAEEAGEHNYCGTCGLRLAEQPELPTRAEWEAAAKPVEASSTDAASSQIGSLDCANSVVGPTRRSIPRRGGLWRPLEAAERYS